jgi:predicted Zn-dependent protease
VVVKEGKMNEEHVYTLRKMVHRGVVSSTSGALTDHESAAIQAAVRALEAEDKHRAEVDQLWRDKEGMRDVIRGRLRALEQMESRYRALVEAASSVMEHVNQTGASYPDHMGVPTRTVDALDAALDALEE